MRTLLVLVVVIFLSAKAPATTCNDLFKDESARISEHVREVDVRNLLSTRAFQGEPIAMRLSANGRFIGVLGNRDMYILKVNASAPRLSVFAAVHKITERMRSLLSQKYNSDVTLLAVVPNNIGENLLVQYRYQVGDRAVVDSFTFEFRDL